MKWKIAVACAALAMPMAPSVALADSIAEVEGARAMERSYGTTRQDREKLRRYGGNDDYGRRYDYGYYGYGGDGYYGGPSVGIYVGPGYGPRGYYPY